jgi:hypothetical protein
METTIVVSLSDIADMILARVSYYSIWQALEGGYICCC